jgi:Uma2 family endonuclease
MAVARKVWTYQDLCELPEDPSKRYEIIDGELYVSPSPRVPHQRTVGACFRYLARAEDAGYGYAYPGNVDVVLDEQNVFVPDLIFIAKDRLSIANDANVRGAPDVVVEVLSPGTKHRDFGPKLEAYARAGVKFYWVADTFSRTMQVFQRQEDGTFAEPALLEGGDALSCPLFPDLTVPVSELFS